MTPIKKQSLKAVVIPSSIYGSDKKPISPVIQSLMQVVNDAVRKDKETVEAHRRK